MKGARMPTTLPLAGWALCDPQHSTDGFFFILPPPTLLFLHGKRAWEGKKTHKKPHFSAQRPRACLQQRRELLLHRKEGNKTTKNQHPPKKTTNQPKLRPKTFPKPADCSQDSSSLWVIAHWNIPHVSFAIWFALPPPSLCCFAK